MVQPIWQVLAELEIEGEYCAGAIAAVERVSTQMFQIVIIDWDDQPEAVSLLKTTRDLRATQRPLILAIVSEEALPEALQAGANSVLVKPIRAVQVLETLSTACELLRAKQQPGRAAAGESGEAAMGAAAGTGGPAATPLFVVQGPEKSFRAGEFLQSPGSAPSGAFHTEGEDEVQKSLDQAAIAEVDALIELEPMAAVVQEGPGVLLEPSEAAGAREALTGWASLQARISRNAAKPVENASAHSQLLGYGETPSYGAAIVTSDAGAADSAFANTAFTSGLGAAPEARENARKEAREEVQPETREDIFREDAAKLARKEPGHGAVVLVTVLATCAIVAAVPATRVRSLRVGRMAAASVKAWLNPPPPALPQPVPLHDDFGQAGDEFKLPAGANPNSANATTDPSQIKVEPVVDPMAKPDKSAEATAGANPENRNSDNQATGNQGAGVAVTANAGNAVPNPAPVAPTSVTPVASQPQDAPQNVTQNAPQTSRTTAPAHVTAPAVLVPVRGGTAQGIPSSLRSQIGSSTPEAGGAMPPEAAMSSIEPVVLPEAAVLDLLTQQPAPAEYPARANGQRGSVILQVVIGRDGVVKDAKFLQGSLVFARAAIEAVKQWQFKPYSLNGRPVSVQSSIVLSFKPPA